MRFDHHLEGTLRVAGPDTFGREPLFSRETVLKNEEIFVRFMNDDAFQKTVTTWMASEAYRRLRESARLRFRPRAVRVSAGNAM